MWRHAGAHRGPHHAGHPDGRYVTGGGMAEGFQQSDHRHNGFRRRRGRPDGQTAHRCGNKRPVRRRYPRPCRPKRRSTPCPRPKILALHGKPSRVQVGGRQGYKTNTFTPTGTTENISFLDTGTILDITPYIDDKGNVLLEVKPQINSVTFDTAGNPNQKTTTVSTSMLAKRRPDHFHRRSHRGYQNRNTQRCALSRRNPRDCAPLRPVARGHRQIGADRSDHPADHRFGGEKRQDSRSSREDEQTGGRSGKRTPASPQKAA